MKVKVHFIPIWKLFHEFPQLIQSVKQLNSSSTIKVIRFYEPNITTLIHLIIKIKLSIYHSFVFTLCLYGLILSYVRIDLSNLFIDGNCVLFLYAFNAIEELTEFINFLQTILCWKINDKLYWQVLEHV